MSLKTKTKELGGKKAGNGFTPTMERVLLPSILIRICLSLVASLIDAIFVFSHHCFSLSLFIVIHVVVVVVVVMVSAISKKSSKGSLCEL